MKNTEILNNLKSQVTEEQLEALEDAIIAIETLEKYKEYENVFKEIYPEEAEEIIVDKNSFAAWLLLTKTIAQKFDELLEVTTKHLDALEKVDFVKKGNKETKIKPEFIINLNDYTSRFKCECGYAFLVKHDSGIMDNNDAPQFCCKCGKEFDWEEEGE